MIEEKFKYKNIFYIYSSHLLDNLLPPKRSFYLSRFIINTPYKKKERDIEYLRIGHNWGHLKTQTQKWDKAHPNTLILNENRLFDRKGCVLLHSASPASILPRCKNVWAAKDGLSSMEALHYGCKLQSGNKTKLVYLKDIQKDVKTLNKTLSGIVLI